MHVVSTQYRHRERSRSWNRDAYFHRCQGERCVFWLEEKKSSTQVQGKFRFQCRKEPPSRPSIYSWHKNFVDIGFSVRHTESPGRPCVSDATVEQLRESFVWSPRKSTQRECRRTGVPYVTVWRVLRKCLHSKTYKLSIVQHLTDAFLLRRWKIQWNLYKAEPHGTENIFHNGQISALYKINNADSSGRDYRICSHWANFRLKFRLIQVSLYYEPHNKYNSNIIRI
jgi:hypothetical protein